MDDNQINSLVTLVDEIAIQVPANSINIDNLYSLVALNDDHSRGTEIMELESFLGHLGFIPADMFYSLLKRNFTDKYNQLQKSFPILMTTYSKSRMLVDCRDILVPVGNEHRLDLDAIHTDYMPEMINYKDLQKTLHHMPD
ncbi:hypothetical protein DY037_05530 [Apilactobacillus micheneri]|uniref:hypothetical protein n=1 Tax=Apilactobacillus micheneri TaxID=1899430 RepID=UPI001126691A|nr:hypothetical protein [Apilactobacillus micheneri]TPR49242.1 hypothetical protein DY037_05530 [Apilactobacillus micheneri]